LCLMDPKIIPQLLEVVKNQDSTDAFDYACEAMQYMGKTAASAAPTLIKLMNDDSLDRASMAIAMTKIAPEHPGLVPALSKLLTSDYIWEVCEGARALGIMGENPRTLVALPLLLKLADHPEDDVRESSCHAISRVGGMDPRAKAALQKLARDKSRDVRGNAGLYGQKYGLRWK
jgi:HEAT repeat protein